MHYRKLGRTGLATSEIGYGTWGMGGDAWKGGSDEEALAALRRSIELGVNFLDTALAYGQGHSEELIGQVLRESTAKVLVASKIPPLDRRWPPQPGVGIEDVFPVRHIIDSTEASLRNLGVETLDVQQLHVWNPEWVDQMEWYRTLEELKKSGKVRFIGISVNAHQPDSTLSLIETGLIDTVQVIYNRTQAVIPLLIVATVWYLLITTVLTSLQYYVERHFARGALRQLPATPLQRLRGWLKEKARG